MSKEKDLDTLQYAKGLKPTCCEWDRVLKLADTVEDLEIKQQIKSIGKLMYHTEEGNSRNV